jgi:hypothetical protein
MTVRSHMSVTVGGGGALRGPDGPFALSGCGCTRGLRWATRPQAAGWAEWVGGQPEGNRRRGIAGLRRLWAKTKTGRKGIEGREKKEKGFC